MASDSPTAQVLGTSTQQTAERKVIEEAKPMDQVHVSFKEEGKEKDNPKSEHFPNEAKQISKSEEDTFEKSVESSIVGVSIDDDAVVDVPVKNKIEEDEKSAPEPVNEAVNGTKVTQIAVKSVAEVVEQLPAVASVEETCTPELSVEAVEKPKELSDVLLANESEQVIVKHHESQAASVAAGEPESVVPEFEVEFKEQPEVSEQVENAELVEEIDKQKESPEVLPIKEREEFVKDVEVSAAAAKEVDEPELVVPVVEEKEQSEVKEQVAAEPVAPEEETKLKEPSGNKEQVEPELVVPELEEKPKEQSEVTEQAEPEQVEAEVTEKPTEQSEVRKQVEPESVVEQKAKDQHEPQPLVPEVEENPKEQSEVAEQVEPESVIFKVEEAPKEQSEVTEKAELEPVDPEVEVNSKEQREVAEQVEPESVVLKVEEQTKEPSEVKEHAQPESVAPKVEINPKEQCEVAEQVEPESVVLKVEEETKEPSEVTEQAEPELVPREVVANPKERSEDAEQVQSEPLVLKVEEKPKEPSEVTEQAESVKELDAAVTKDEPESAFVEVEGKADEDSLATEEVNKPKVLGPEVDVKPEEQSIVIEEVERPNLQDPEVDAKTKEERQVEEIKTDKNEEQIEPHGEVKTAGETEVAGQVEAKEIIRRENVIDEGTLADKIDDTAPKACKEEKSSAVFLPDVMEKAILTDGKKETDGANVAVVSSKEKAVEIEKGVEEKEEDSTKIVGETAGRSVPNEELSQPNKVNDVESIISNAEVTEKPEGETNSKCAGENLDEASKNVTVTEPTQGSEVREEESAKTGNVELANSDVQDAKPPTKDGDDKRTSRNVPTETPAKVQKQSSNILTKMKQSLVKAKKAIIGKSPNSKTIISDAKGEMN